MTWLSFTVEMTKALAWPALIVFVLLYFKKELFGLLHRLASMRVGGLEARFAQEEAKVAEAISKTDPQALPKTDKQDALIELARVSPRTAIIDAAVRVETVLREMAEKFTPDVPNRPPGQLIRLLNQRGAVDDQTASSLQGLFSMRNMAVHSPHDDLTPDRAIEFIVLSNAVLYLLDRV